MRTRKASTLIVASALSVALVLAGVALAATIRGTQAGETLDGTTADDIIVAKGGNDIVNGDAGNDRIGGGRGNDTLAVTLLASLPALAHRLGGSHAQRDVLHLTLLRAVERVRRPQRRSVRAPLAAAAQVGRQVGQLLTHGVVPQATQAAS